MRPLVAAIAILTALSALIGALSPSPLVLLAVGLSAAGLAAFGRNSTLSAGAYMGAFIALALSRAALLSPLAELAAFLTLYGSRLNELGERLIARGYDKAEVDRALARAGLAVSLRSAVALIASYLLFYALLGLPRLPPGIALAFSATSLALILILSLGRRKR